MKAVVRECTVKGEDKQFLEVRGSLPVWFGCCIVFLTYSECQLSTLLYPPE